MPQPGSKGHGKSGHLSDRLRRKAPRRYFAFTFSQPARGEGRIPAGNKADDQATLRGGPT